MRRTSALIAAAVLLAGCGGSGKTVAPAPTSKPSASPTPSPSSSFATKQSRDQLFLSALSGSPYAAEYTSQTQEDLTAMAAQDCTDIETGHDAQTVVRALNITHNEQAQAFLIRTAVETYCPNLSSALPNLIGN